MNESHRRYRTGDGMQFVAASFPVSIWVTTRMVQSESIAMVNGIVKMFNVTFAPNHSVWSVGIFGGHYLQSFCHALERSILHKFQWRALFFQVWSPHCSLLFLTVAIHHAPWLSASFYLIFPFIISSIWAHQPLQRRIVPCINGGFIFWGVQRPEPVCHPPSIFHSSTQVLSFKFPLTGGLLIDTV